MKHLFIILIGLLSFQLAAQTASNELVHPDEKLAQVYSADYLSRLQTQNPFLIQRWNFALKNGWHITDLPEGKDAGFKSVRLSNLEDVNILLLQKEQGIHRDFNKRQYYKIENTEKVLILHSGKEFRDALNKHLGRTYK